jgi:transcriptional regulator with XRE-family HTH domain
LDAEVRRAASKVLIPAFAAGLHRDRGGRLRSGYKAVYKLRMDARSVAALRKKLALTQQAFASLLGLSFVSVNKWENGASTPTGLSAVLLELLGSALRVHSSTEIIRALRATEGAPLDIIRTLTAMERTRVRPRA